MSKFFTTIREKIGSASSLRRQLLYGGIGNGLIQAGNRLVGLFFAVVLARTIGTEGYGTYAYAMAILTLLMIPGEFGTPNLLVREIAAGEARQEWSNIRGIIIRFLQIVFAVSIFLATIAATLIFVFGSNLPETLRNTLFLMLILLPIMTLSQTMLSAMRGFQHVVKSQAVGLLLRPLLVLIVVALLFALIPDMRSPQQVMIIQIFIGILLGGYTIYLLYRYMPPPIRTVAATYKTRQWIGSAIPFILLSSAFIINSQADILMLGMFQPVEDVGMYRVATQGASLVAFGLHAVNSVVAPQFAKMYAKNEIARLQRLVTTSARIVLLIATPFALVFIFAGEPLISLIFGAEFAPAYAPLKVLTYGQLFNTAMGSVGFLLTMSGHEKIALKTMLITATLNVILNFIFIPLYGTTGAAIATTITLIFWNIILYFEVKNRIGILSTAFSFLKSEATR
ncbi:MAG: flippase [Magnetococcales bacterium]|nr:flippase [Magnetococcales bacterium]